MARVFLVLEQFTHMVINLSSFIFLTLFYTIILFIFSYFILLHHNFYYLFFILGLTIQLGGCWWRISYLSRMLMVITTIGLTFFLLTFPSSYLHNSHFSPRSEIFLVTFFLVFVWLRVGLTKLLAKGVSI
jgi:hypothetical protein